MSANTYYLVGLLILSGIGLVYLLRKDGAGTGNETLMDTAELFVTAAEQMFPDKTGAEKLTWVTQQVRSLGWFQNMDPNIIRACIEAAVFALKRPAN